MTETTELIKAVTNLILALGGVSIVFWAAVRFLGKKTIDYFFDKTLAKFNIQFSKLHQDRAEVIRELYEKLLQLHHAMRAYTSSGQILLENETFESKMDANRNKLNIALYEARQYFLPKRIYFKKELAVEIEDFIGKCLNIEKEFSEINREKNSFWVEPKEKHELSKQLITIYNNVDEELASMLGELEKEFRSILGVD